MPNFFDLSYLKVGNSRQQAAYAVLSGQQVMERLAPFNPALAGTIPINIDLETSDLDILCCWENKALFIAHLVEHFSKESRFRWYETLVEGCETVIANCFIAPYEVEIFGQQRPVVEQTAYRHLLIEQQILDAKGEAFRQAVVQLKKQGYKTEPAFARLLNLSEENPYTALLEYGQNCPDF